MSRSVKKGVYPSPFGKIAFCAQPSLQRRLDKPWALVGLSGCGKSSLAQALARTLNIECIDSDALIEREQGLTIVEIFARKGEAFFRTAEQTLLRRIAKDWRQGKQKPFVLASGGGAMAFAASRRVLQQHFTTVWIDCPLHVLSQRLADADDRPLLAGGGGGALLKEMSERRRVFYRQAHAHLVLSGEESLAELVACFSEATAATAAVSKTLSAVDSGKRESMEESTEESISLDLPSESYEVVVGEELLEQASSLLPPRAMEGKVILVAERKMRTATELLRQNLQSGGCVVVVIALSVSESQKRLHSVETLCRHFAEVGADRRSFVIVLGGGVLCDVAAFAASVFMRGLPFALFPTTLLAQVDAAIGGKNGVNSVAGKNMLGVFRQPKVVLCDTGLLKTLPEREMRCGYAEILKYAMITDAGFFAWLEQHGRRLLAHEPSPLLQAIVHSVRIKARIVEQDAEERSGVRALLNFGHTFGHALEHMSLYALAHGDAVAFGCVIATRLAVATGRCKAEVAERLEAHAERCGLPVRLADLGLSAQRLQQVQRADRWVETMKFDKKGHADAVRLVLPSKIGACTLQAPMGLQALRARLQPILLDLA